MNLNFLYKLSLENISDSIKIAKENSIIAKNGLSRTFRGEKEPPVVLTDIVNNNYDFYADTETEGEEQHNHAASMIQKKKFLKIHEPKLFVCRSKLDASALVANQIENLIKIIPDATLGFATGSTPLDLYKILAQHYQDKQEIDYSQVSSFNLDEYIGLDSEHYLESYNSFMHDNLFKKINIKNENTFFPIDWDENINPSTYVSHYDNIISSHGGINLQILGIGSNGHIAFNEPGSSIHSLTRVVKLTKNTIHDNARFFTSPNDVPTHAVSMGLQSILNADEIVLMAFGEYKANAINKLFTCSEYDPEWPCSALLFHPRVTIYVDREAASILRKKERVENIKINKDDENFLDWEPIIK